MVHPVINDIVGEIFKNEKYVDAFGLKLPVTAIQVMRELQDQLEKRSAELDAMKDERDAWKAEWLKLHKQQSKLRYWKEQALKKAKV